MEAPDLLNDSFAQVDELVASVLKGIEPSHLLFRPAVNANSIAWLVWHLTRGQDHQVAEVSGSEQVWMAQGFVDRFGLPLDPSATGYGQTPDEAASVNVTDGALLLEYHRAVHVATDRYLASLGPTELDRIVDESYDPPVTLGTRLRSVVADDLLHAGQAAYVRGLAEA
jgi:Protein of unknown function (DUF664)